MGINLINLNGKCQFVDSLKFEKDFNTSLQLTCTEATITFFNNFPLLTSTEIKTNLVIIVCIKNKRGNYFRNPVNSRNYLYNIIIPVSYFDNYYESNITYDIDAGLLIDDFIYDFENDTQSLKQGLTNYLTNKCGFEKTQLNIIPLIFIKHYSTLLLKNGLIISKLFDWKTLSDYIFSSSKENIVSYKPWNADFGYEKYLSDVELLNNKASEDSTFGYLTKKKIDRIGRKLSNTKRNKKKPKAANILFEDDVLEEMKSEAFLNDHESCREQDEGLLLIKGKAGTGKTNELITLMLENLGSSKNARYMTYNHLLVHDVSKIVKAYSNRNEMHGIGQFSVTTLHRFFYRLSKNLGILHLMTDERLEKLKIVLTDRMDLVIKELKHITENYGNQIFRYNIYNSTKEFLTNSKNINKACKDVAIDFINFLRKNNLSITNELEQSSIKFFRHKEASLENICFTDCFISNYYEVLLNILKAINDPVSFHEEFVIKNKFALLYAILKFKERYLNNFEIQNETIPVDVYKKIIANVMKGHRMGNALILIDEGQDCHPNEKEILFKVFGSNNIAVASGGKEQLIRLKELCRWTTSNGKRIPHTVYNTTQNKSYRIKKDILGLCNFIASAFSIEFKLEPFHKDDSGELIIDTRKALGEKENEAIFEKLLLKGSLNNCVPYEGLLIMTNPATGTNDNVFSTTTIINEYNNIEERRELVEQDLPIYNALNSVCPFWDGTKDDVRKNYLPSYGETRLIYYNSCRGLEAWSTVCLDIDSFFNKKYNEKDAEKYLMSDLLLTLDERKKMYAATWVLMALTRAIDTMYLKIADVNSVLGKLIIEYANQNPNDCTLMK